MLHKNDISAVQIYSDEWHIMRIGKLTSSRWHTQMGEKELTDGAMTYLYHKVGETMTGHTTSTDGDDIIEDENTTWGLQYEPFAIAKFQQKMKVEFLATQKLIHKIGSQFSSTPDAIWIHGLALNGEEYNVSTLEVKCPRKFHKYIPFYQCKKPSDLKKLSKIYYWQVLHQMSCCDSAVGYFAVFHPLFPEGSNFRMIEFKKMELWDDFKLLEQRKVIAINKINEIKISMLSGE